MLSKKAEYGLQSLLLLAGEYGQGPLLIAELAERGRMPRKFLEQILLQIRNADLLQSRKGRWMGHELARPPSKNGIGRAIRILDGPLVTVACIGETAIKRCPECHDETACGI